MKHFSFIKIMAFVALMCGFGSQNVVAAMPSPQQVQEFATDLQAIYAQYQAQGASLELLSHLNQFNEKYSALDYVEALTQAVQSKILPVETFCSVAGMCAGGALGVGAAKTLFGNGGKLLPKAALVGVGALGGGAIGEALFNSTPLGRLNDACTKVLNQSRKLRIIFWIQKNWKSVLGYSALALCVAGGCYLGYGVYSAYSARIAAEAARIVAEKAAKIAAEAAKIAAEKAAEIARIAAEAAAVAVKKAAEQACANASWFEKLTTNICG